MKKPLILITGPTASGKTQSSVRLAEYLNGEIISADSMQVYRGMDIGTAKVKKEEMRQIPHHMIDVMEADESCNISWFKTQVAQKIDEVIARGKVPILVGGTGFYINAVLFDTTFEEAEALPSYREALEAEVKVIGNEALHRQLQDIDPESAQAIHPNNVKRVIRALEYYKQTGKCISAHNQEEKAKHHAIESPYAYTFFALEMDRALLYERINYRVDLMVAEGLVEEVEKFYKAGYTSDMPSMKAIGYKELFPYFEGKASLEECIALLKQNTRHYAKRQMTWLRNQAKPHFIRVDQHAFDSKEIVEEMIQVLKKKMSV